MLNKRLSKVRNFMKIIIYSILISLIYGCAHQRPNHSFNSTTKVVTKINSITETKLYKTDRKGNKVLIKELFEKDGKKVNLTDLENKCLKGDKKSCGEVSSIYADTDHDKTIKWGKKGCELKDYVSCANVGKTLLFNTQNSNETLKYLNKGCSAKIARACTNLGFYYSGTEIKKELKYGKLGCKLKNAQGCSNVSVYYNENKDYKNTVKYLKKSCEINQSSDCYDAAYYSYFLLKDKKSYESILNKGCEKRDLLSCVLASAISFKENKHKQNFYYSAKACSSYYKVKQCNSNITWFKNESKFQLEEIEKSVKKQKKEFKENPKSKKKFFIHRPKYLRM